MMYSQPKEHCYFSFFGKGEGCQNNLTGTSNIKYFNKFFNEIKKTIFCDSQL